MNSNFNLKGNIINLFNQDVHLLTTNNELSTFSGRNILKMPSQALSDNALDPIGVLNTIFYLETPQPNHPITLDEINTAPNFDYLPRVEKYGPASFFIVSYEYVLFALSRRWDYVGRLMILNPPVRKIQQGDQTWAVYQSLAPAKLLAVPENHRYLLSDRNELLLRG